MTTTVTYRGVQYRVIERKAGRSRLKRLMTLIDIQPKPAKGIDHMRIIDAAYKVRATQPELIRRRDLGFLRACGITPSLYRL